MKPNEMLDFANSLLKGSTIEEQIKAHHEKLKKTPAKLVGRSWLNGFLRRHGKYLCTGRGHWVYNKRQEWATYKNFEKMYKLVYQNMVAAGIARYLPELEHYFVDSQGNTVEKQEEAAGMKVTIELTHPEWGIMGDEVGTNTTQDEDGHIGGQTYIGPKGARIALSASKASGKFTVMGLTSFSNQPVMCVVIFAALKMPLALTTGLPSLTIQQKTWKKIVGLEKLCQASQHVTFVGMKSRR